MSQNNLINQASTEYPKNILGSDSIIETINTNKDIIPPISKICLFTFFISILIYFEFVQPMNGNVLCMTSYVG